MSLASQGRKFQNKNTIENHSSFYWPSLHCSIEISTFSWLSLHFFVETSTFSSLFYCFLFTFHLKSLLSLHFSIEISMLSFLVEWNPYFSLSLYFSIEMSTFSSLFYRNLYFLFFTYTFGSCNFSPLPMKISILSVLPKPNPYFLFTFLLRSLPSLHSSIEISTAPLVDWATSWLRYLMT